MAPRNDTRRSMMAERVSKKKSIRKGPLISTPACNGPEVARMAAERMARRAAAMETLEASFAKRRPMGFEM